LYICARAGAVAKNVAGNKIVKAEMRIGASVAVASGEPEHLPGKGTAPAITAALMDRVQAVLCLQRSENRYCSSNPH
jgi:hypothetical protein